MTARLLFCFFVVAVVVVGGVVAVDDLFLDLDKEAYYPTYADAAADGATSRGWIQAYVPESAMEIRESHNLDTNMQWLTFVFEPNDREAMQTELNPVDSDEIEFPWPRATRQRSWWPKKLRRPSADIGETLEFYRYHSPRHETTTYIAIEKDVPRVWAWMR